MQKTQVYSWVGKIPWGRAQQPTPIFLPGESPWTEEPGELQSIGSQRVGHDWAMKNSTAHSLMLAVLLWICCCCRSVVTSCPTLYDPTECSPPSSSDHRISQARILEWVSLSFSRASSWPRDRICVSCIAGSFCTIEPPWSESESESHSVVSNSLWPHGLYSSWNSPGQNTGVSSLSLLQGIFPTQGLNPGLPHCRWILYQLSHRGSPKPLFILYKPFNQSLIKRLGESGRGFGTTDINSQIVSGIPRNFTKQILRVKGSWQ